MCFKKLFFNCVLKFLFGRIKMVAGCSTIVRTSRRVEPALSRKLADLWRLRAGLQEVARVSVPGPCN